MADLFTELFDKGISSSATSLSEVIELSKQLVKVDRVKRGQRNILLSLVRVEYSLVFAKGL